MSFSPRPMSFGDRLTLGLIIGFILSAWTVELYWLLNRQSLLALADTQGLARLFRWYGTGDRRYFDTVSPLNVAMETINVSVTQIAHLLLIYGIVKLRPYRHPLQLCVSSYSAYGQVLYLAEAHCAGYAAMLDKSAWGFFIFLVPNLPFLLGHLYMAVDSFLALSKPAKISTDRLQNH